jgi:hypothetical protein
MWVAQAARVPTIAANTARLALRPHSGVAQAIEESGRSRCMVLLLLEALGAGVLLVLIVWWTMFSGRKNGEIVHKSEEKQPPTPKE